VVRGGSRHTFDEPFADLPRRVYGLESECEERRRTAVLIACAAAGSADRHVHRQNDRVARAGNSKRIERRDRFGFFVGH
jgi:hypothetical protein